MRATAQQPQRAPDGAPVHYERHRPEQTSRMHGGKSGRKPTHGRYARKALERQREVRELIRMLSELVGS